MLDRLKELRKDGGDAWKEEDIEEVAIEIKPEETANQQGQDADGPNPEMVFLAETKQIKAMLDSCEANIKFLESEYQTSLKATSSDAAKLVKERITFLINETKGHSKDVKDRLQKMLDETKRREDTEGLSAEVRIRKQLHAFLTARFVAALREYQAIQDRFRQDSKERIARQLKIVNPKATEDEIDVLMQKQGQLTASDIFQTDLLTRQQRSTLESVFVEVSETHRDVLELEFQFRELQEMFIDFATLIAHQDEMFDVIERNVNQSVAYVETGRTRIKQSKKSNKRSRKVMFIIFLVSMIILFVVAMLAIGLGVALPIIIKRALVV